MLLLSYGSYDSKVQLSCVDCSLLKTFWIARV